MNDKYKNGVPEFMGCEYPGNGVRVSGFRNSGMNDYSDSGNAVPDTSNQITCGKGIKASVDPIKIEINKEHFRKKFEGVVTEWVQYRKLEGVSEEDSNKLLEELLKCFDEER